MHAHPPAIPYVVPAAHCAGTTPLPVNIDLTVGGDDSTSISTGFDGDDTLSRGVVNDDGNIKLTANDSCVVKLTFKLTAHTNPDITTVTLGYPVSGQTQYITFLTGNTSQPGQLPGSSIPPTRFSHLKYDNNTGVLSMTYDRSPIHVPYFDSFRLLMTVTVAGSPVEYLVDPAVKNTGGSYLEWCRSHPGLCRGHYPPRHRTT
jgi:hypothetical protein